jgi:hypothetical protein
MSGRELKNALMAAGDRARIGRTDRRKTRRSSPGFRAAHRRRLSKRAQNCLLRLFRTLPLAKADARAAAVLVDELDASIL